MAKLTQQIAILERIDQLIRLKSTGKPKQLAERLGVSEATVFRMIEIMKEMNAPICYDLTRQSYIYTKMTSFKCGFYVEELDSMTERNLSGGCGFVNMKQLLNF
ncbi:HTH domain-containing protein [Allomuricauda sp. SCSIO 65647]|uniref:HTH domain-containing protein n=1 Tax=Allomuricauda sp. SCSIO 65647 TaxID=2908843 RepID=UPI001F333C41|nr:helix-turn-helix domain-containing protein [Muricauda sp. SCSIO 65647]UJH67227.1 helix-turn-helix domain-containing protein [Muricauda sp. SCSIO 65647]